MIPAEGGPAQTRSHQDKLDALRGLAAIAVLLSHAGQVFLWRVLGEHGLFAALTSNLARHAVLVFFLLSGYLITQSIQANVRRHGRFSAGEYLVARITRIYPPLLAAVIVTTLVSWALHGVRFGGFDDAYRVRASLWPVNLDEIIRALVMQDGLLQANGPLWTLYIEVRLYLVAGLLAIAWANRAGVACTAAAILLTYYLQQTVEFALFAGVWGLGAVAALWAQHLRLVRWLTGLVVLGLAWVAVTAPALLDCSHPNWGGISQLAFGLVYLEAIRSKLGSSPPAWMVRTADFSYSLYVIHFPLLLLALGATQDWLGGSLWRLGVTAALATAGCVLAAFWCARVFEDQRRFKHAIRRAILSD